MDEEEVETIQTLMNIIAKEFNMETDKVKRIIIKWGNNNPKIECNPLYNDGDGLLVKL
jgi:hypothetical protein